MNKLQKIKEIYNKEKDNGRGDVILYNIIYYLGKYSFLKVDSTNIYGDILTIYDNLWVNNEIIDEDNLSDYMDYLKKIKPNRLNYYIKEITKNNKIILLNYYSPAELKYCFLKLEAVDYGKLGE